MSCKPSDRRFTKGVFSEGKPQLSYHRCQDDDDDDDDDYGHDVEEEKIPIIWLPLSIIFVPLFHLNTFDKKRNETLIEFFFLFHECAVCWGLEMHSMPGDWLPAVGRSQGWTRVMGPQSFLGL